MGRNHWVCLIVGAAVGYFVLPTVIGLVRSKIG
jgi:hypothetical protein